MNIYSTYTKLILLVSLFFLSGGQLFAAAVSEEEAIAKLKVEIKVINEELASSPRDSALLEELTLKETRLQRAEQRQLAQAQGQPQQQPAVPQSQASPIPPQVPAAKKGADPINIDRFDAEIKGLEEKARGLSGEVRQAYNDYDNDRENSGLESTWKTKRKELFRIQSQIKKLKGERNSAAVNQLKESSDIKVNDERVNKVVMAEAIEHLDQIAKSEDWRKWGTWAEIYQEEGKWADDKVLIEWADGIIKQSTDKLKFSFTDSATGLAFYIFGTPIVGIRDMLKANVDILRTWGAGAAKGARSVKRWLGYKLGGTGL